MNDDQIRKFIKEINAECADGNYIFRGTNKVCSTKKDGSIIEDGISSKLYWESKNLKEKWNEHYKPADAEKDIVERFRARLTDRSQYTNIEILTDLRHFGTGVALIDFSLDIYTSLFFACNSQFGNNGEFIMLERSEIPHIEEIKYEDSTLSIINPAPTKDAHKRAMSQNSIFVHAPDGFIPPKDPKDPKYQKDKYIVKSQIIKSGCKKDILAYLEKHHKISQKTIYNDLWGFIENEKNYAASRNEFIEGNLHVKKGEYDEAIKMYNAAINKDPTFVEAYANRGIAKQFMGIDRWRDIIMANSGIAQVERRDSKGAIRDSKGAIRDFEGAIRDFKKAIEIDPWQGKTLRPLIKTAKEYIVKAAEEQRKAEQNDDSTESTDDEENQEQ